MNQRKDQKIMKELIYNDIVVRCGVESETVWLTQKQMCGLFAVDKANISRHLKNVFEEGELSRDSVVANFATTAADGKTYDVEFYNLDVIISVGFRVRASPVATRFRQWANGQLREILLGRQVNDREQRLWAAYEKEPSARCRAQLLRLMGVVCEPPRGLVGRELPPARPARALEPVAPNEFWRLLQAHWDELRPEEWLRTAESEWCLDRAVVVARLRAVAAGARRWSVRSVGAGLMAFGVTVGRRYFPGRSGGQFCWCVPRASVPAALSNKAVEAQVR